MKYKIEYLPVAVRDLTDIATYISVTLKDVQSADKLADEIIGAIDSLCDMPYRCPVYYPPKPLSNEYRKLRVKNYIVFYSVNEDKKIVTVFRVLYQKRELEKLL